MPLRIINGIINIRFRVPGARYRRSTGLPDTPENRKCAETIELEQRELARKGKSISLRANQVLKKVDRPGRILSDAEIDRYLAVANLDLHDGAILMLEIGLLSIEVVRLRRTDVDLYGNTIRIQNRLHPTKNQPGRKLPMTKRAKEILAPRMCGRTAWLFPSPLHPLRARTSLESLHLAALAKTDVAPFSLTDLLVTFEARQLALGVLQKELATSLKLYRNKSNRVYGHKSS